MEGYHKSVLVEEVLDALVSLGGGIRNALVLDATLGDGGHSLEILKRGGKVIGIDVDPQALDRARQRFENLGISKKRYKLVLGNFRGLKNLIRSSFAEASEDKQTELKFEGVLFDLGVSSLQLKSPNRGFSFSKEGPLDMRMDLSLGVKALDLVNALNKGELYELFTSLGEEKFSRQLAEALVSARCVRRIDSTKQLADLVESTIGRRGNIHPATQIFQALRIAVNDELNALKEALPQALEISRMGGIILVISFHSLEDRIVKNTFVRWEVEGLGEVMTKKPIVPGEEEVKMNPRSRSAKLRVFKKR